MKKCLFLLLIVVITGSLFISGCGKSDETTTTATPSETPATSVAPTSTPEPTSSPGPVSGGILKIIHEVKPNQLGYPPLGRTLWDGLLNAPAVETLLGRGANGTLIPRLAESWEVGPDGTSYILHLKKGIKFHDGTDFNAEAVKFDLELYAENKMADLSLLSSVDVIDEYTVQINLTAFSNAIPGALADFGGQMISPTAYKANGKDWCITHPVGTGPFIFDNWDPDVAITYTKFNDYWQEGKPYLDGVEFRMIADPVTASIAFQKGEGQSYITLAAKEVYDLTQSGDYVVAVTGGSVVSITFDSTNPESPFADVRVRKAVGYAIDWEAIAMANGYGYFEPTNQLTGEGMWAYSPNVVGTPYNVEKAKQLLAEAGYPDGFEINQIAMVSGMVVPMMTGVQGYLREVGIITELEAAPAGKFIQYMRNGWDGLIMHAIHAGTTIDSAVKLRNTFTSYVSNAWVSEIADIVDEALIQTDSEKKIALTWEAMKKVIDEYALVASGVYQTIECIKYPEVMDMDTLINSDRAWTPENVWLSE